MSMLTRWVISLAALPCILTAQPPLPTARELRNLLADDDQAWGEQPARDVLLYHENRLRPSLRALLRDPKARAGAQEILSLIGDPDDLRVLLHLPPPSHSGPFENRWAYGVVCALLEPGTEQEWKFLRDCALNAYDDRWVDAGAIQTLKLMASSRSLEILKEVRQHNHDREKSTARAIEYVQSNPPPLRGRELEELAGRVANVIRIGTWEGNEKARYNKDGDKALVDFAFRTLEDRLIYTGTFHRIDGVWRLSGVRETLQMLVPPPPPPPAKK